MNILLYVLANSETGLGHWSRMIALAHALVKRGHQVTVAGNCNAGGLPAGTQFVTDHDLVTRTNPLWDWRVYDLPAWAYEMISYVPGAKPNLCFIDAPDGFAADLVVSQGETGQYQAPKHLLLHPGIFSINQQDDRWGWFVYGGTGDRLGLRAAFAKAIPNDEAVFLVPDDPNGIDHDPMPFLHWFAKAEGTGLYELMARAERACVTMGVTAWECVALGLKTFVFSPDERSLATARWMDFQGWVKAWPEVGLPDVATLGKFLDRPFFPWPCEGLDGKGAERVAQLLEMKS